MIRLSIKNPNSKIVQSNNSQIVLNGIKNSLDENQNYLNSKNRNDRSPCSSNRSSPNSKDEKLKIAQLEMENDKETKDSKDKSSELNGAYKNNDENLSAKRRNDQTDSIRLSKDEKQSSVDIQAEFPKLEKLIQVEIKKFENKNGTRKLIRCNTAIEIDNYCATKQNNSKFVQNHKLIFSESVG